MKDLMLRQVSKELAKISKTGDISRPAAGWIRTIREAIGMTSTQLAKRLGVIQQRVSALEKAEAEGTLKVKTLNEAAQALDCKLVYFFVPHDSLEETLKKRAFLVATEMVEESSHTMDLESQPISSEEKQQQIRKLAQELLESRSKRLWDS